MSQGYYNPDQNMYYVTDETGTPIEGKPLDLAVHDGDLSGDALKAIDTANTDRMMSQPRLEQARAAQQAAAYLKTGRPPANIRPVVSAGQADPQAGGSGRPLVSLADLAPQTDYGQQPAAALSGDSGGLLGMAQKFVTGAAQSPSGIPPDVADYVNRYTQQQDQLKNAQAESNRRATLALLEHAGETFSSAASHGRAPVDEGFTRNALALSGQPVEQAQQNIGMQRQTDAIDPNSPQNRRERAVWEDFFHTQAAADPKYPDPTKLPGWNLTTGQDIEKFLTDTQFRQRMAMEAQRTEATVKGEKLREDEFAKVKAALAVPGWNFAEPLGHTVEEATKARSLEADRAEALPLLEQLRGLVNTTPFTEAANTFTAKNAQMQALQSHLLGMTNKLYELGALTQGHQHLIQSEVLDPTNWKNAAFPKRVLATIDEMEHSIENKRQAMAKSMKATIGPDQSAAPTASDQAPRKTVNGKVYEKRPDGWYEVSDAGPQAQS